MRAPAKAPKIMAKMAAPRRCQRGFSPPAKLESAASPVIVSVNTVVVISGTASFLTIAFLSPMARAVEAMTACKCSGLTLHSNRSPVPPPQRHRGGALPT